MLDDIEKAAMALLGMSKDEVRKVRDALLVEVAADDARYAARTALKHPEGSTTPLNEAADRAQQTYAKVRDKAIGEMPKLIALILAEQVAKQQRDEAGLARDRHWDAEHERRAVGPHPETRDLFARLFQHGVTPWHLKALRDEEVAILADLIRWKANDARYKNPDNPWRRVIGVYAGRLILEAGYGVTVKLSKPGVPVRGKRYTSPKYYMFNEMVEPHWAMPTDEVDQPSADTTEAEDVANVETERQTEQQPLPVEPVGTEFDDVPAVVPITATDEYAIPPHISEPDAARLLVGGRRWVENDSQWAFELKYAIGFSSETEAEIISAVEAATAPAGYTPFRYFLETAKRDGVEAGHAAYREATIRRFAFEFATNDDWKDVRSNLGLSW